MISDGKQYIESCIWGVKYISMGTSEIRTTSQQRTVVPLPMCPLFGRSTVYGIYKLIVNYNGERNVELELSTKKMTNS